MQPSRYLGQRTASRGGQWLLFGTMFLHIHQVMVLACFDSSPGSLRVFLAPARHAYLLLLQIEPLLEASLSACLLTSSSSIR